MSDHRDKKTLIADQALELMMRDTLEGMEDFATAFGFRPWPGDFEIISVEPVAEDDDEQWPLWYRTGTTH